METKLAPTLLVATPHLRDPNFNHTVVLLFEHGSEGAVGLVVNRPLELRVQQVLEDLDIPIQVAEGDPTGLGDRAVQYGGPVSMEIGWLVHSADYQDASTRLVTEDICVSTSREALDAIVSGRGPSHFMLCLGYSGWGEGQLEEEVGQGAWLTVPIDRGIVFDVPIGDRWLQSFRRLGIDPHQLSATIGNA